MKQAQFDLEQELLLECGFWKRFSGEDRRPAHSMLIRLYWSLRLLVAAALLSIQFSFRSRRKDPEHRSCRALLVYLTENQRRAFLPWISDDDDIHTASWMADADWEVSWRRCGLLTLRYFWGVYRLLRKRPDYAETLPWIQEFVRYRVGRVLAADLYMRARPKIIVVSNDHSGMFRAFMRTAREFGCKLVYTQHASIGRNFPVLDFDLSLLDGTQAYLQYRESGVPGGNVVITGRTRPQAAEGASARPGVLTIGLATNLDDSLWEWLPLLFRLRRHFQHIVLRCHPAETRRLAWRVLCRLLRIRMDAVGLSDFLESISILISGMSGIILDAALHGVPCLVKLTSLRTSEGMVDYFGYQKYGLSKPIADMDSLAQLVAATAREQVDFEKVGAFEAGLVQDPTDEKRAILRLLVESLQGQSNLAAELEQRYVRMEHDGVPLFMTAPYALLNQKHGWLADRA